MAVEVNINIPLTHKHDPEKCELLQFTISCDLSIEVAVDGRSYDVAIEEIDALGDDIKRAIRFVEESNGIGKE